MIIRMCEWNGEEELVETEEEKKRMRIGGGEGKANLLCARKKRQIHLNRWISSLAGGSSHILPRG